MSAKVGTPGRPPGVSGPSRRISDSEIWRLGGQFTQVVWRASADGSRFVAPTWTIVTGQPADALHDGGWMALLHPDDRVRVTREWQDAIGDGFQLSVEFRVRMRDGRYEWFRARGEPMRNRKELVKGWIGIMSNIDEQKRADEALHESAVRLGLIVDSARVGTLDWNLEADEIDVNQRGLELLGMRPGAIVTVEELERLVDAEDLPQFRSAIGRALNPAGSGTFESVFRIRHDARQTTWLSVRGSVRFIDEGGTRRGVRLLGVLSDLTQEMRELEDRAWLSTLVASSTDAIIAQTPDGVVTHWNAAAERIFGYTPFEMIGHSVFRLVPPDQVEEAAALLDSVRSGGEVSNVVTERVCKDGRHIIMALTLSPIRDEQGTLIGLSAIERDITADRFRDAQLREAQKLEAVGQLAGGVAHDLNNILTAMMAGVHLVIQNTELDTRARGRLTQVRDECFRASGVIRELLAFGRKQVVTPHVCRLDDIVREAQPMLVRLVDEDVEIDVRLGAKRGIFVDRAQMIQVIISLAVHARDSMPTGGRLSIRTSDEPSDASAPARHVVLTISDTGAGMTDETCARLFEPYFTTRKLGWGTGLGLSVVHAIIGQFGGTIGVESAVGEGTAFTITLPAIDPPAPTAARLAETPAELRGRETVLLVEDERVLRDQLAESLRDLGYLVLEARNGYDALTVLERHGAPIHLVLSDVVMPEMNGATLVAQLREWYPNLRVLFITGYSEEAVASYGVVVSNTELLMKPFMVEELAARIRSVLDGPRQGAEFAAGAQGTVR
ncbi:MAG: sensor histidine kinase response regulator [Gemmatimonadetes bacterium]|nr:sensor histidine kinase response regulator [Gemmatimonadota bacterium]